MKSLQLQVRDSTNQISVLDLPLATQMSNESEGFVSSNATIFETVISTLRDGWSAVVAEVRTQMKHPNGTFGFLTYRSRSLM